MSEKSGVTTISDVLIILLLSSISIMLSMIYVDLEKLVKMNDHFNSHTVCMMTRDSDD